MELPQPSRPFAAEGRKATHDFLSLYGNSPVQQDQQPSSHGAYLKTHNFLQPLDKEGQHGAKEDNANGLNVEKPPPPSAPPPIEQVLPGSIAYSINHVAYLNPRMPKSEGTAFNMASALTVNDRNDENSNASSYTAGSSFTVWDHESSSRKGKTRKENPDDLNLTKDAIVRTGQWPIERPSESSSNHPYGLSFRSSSQPPAHTNQSFVQMLIAAKMPHAKEEDEDEVFTLRNEGSSQKVGLAIILSAWIHTGELQIKVDGRTSNDQKANTPRSKHSATEQRRRCKINDRQVDFFSNIRIVDVRLMTAFYLGSEQLIWILYSAIVIEYIRFLQEKVSKYEGYPGCSSEPTKLTPLRSNPDQTGTVIEPVLMLKPDNKNNVVTTNFQRMQQLPCVPVTNNLIPLNTMDQHTRLTNTASSIPIPQLQADIFPSLRNNNVIAQPASCKPFSSDAADNASVPQLQLNQSRPKPSDYDSNTCKQEIAVEGGTISISSMYSQGLLNTLTHALKSSGVDVSQANISVQVDIGKQTNPQKTRKDFDINCESMDIEDSNQNAKKRLKMCIPAAFDIY
ncbi:hypothetical protein V2J09_014904 [Rumex salicifolius]